MIKPVLGSDLLGELLSRNACLAVSVTRSHLILDSGLNGKPSNHQTNREFPGASAFRPERLGIFDVVF